MHDSQSSKGLFSRQQLWVQLQWELAAAQAEAEAAEKRAQEALEAKAALQHSASELAQKVQDARAQTERTADEVFTTLRAKVPLAAPIVQNMHIVLHLYPTCTTPMTT
jgi:chromosome segregation ATPase